MGNSFQKGISNTCHKSRSLLGLDQVNRSRKGVLKPDFSKEHHISVTHLHELEPIQRSYAFPDQTFIIFQNTIKIEDRYTNREIQDRRGYIEKYLQTLMKKDKLHQWKSIKQLDLWLYDSYVAQFLLPFTDFIIKSFSNLQGIKLIANQSPSSNSHINGKVLQAFVEKIAKHLPNLTKFELLIDGITKVTNSDIKLIIRQILRNLSQLEILILRFDNCVAVTPDCFSAFGLHTQRYLPKLKKLRLSFGENKIRAQNLKFDVFIPNLEFLNLNLSNCFSENTDGSIQVLCSSIGRISTLKKLDIDFSSCTGMTDEGLKIFSQEICGKNTNLIELVASFKSCALLTDNGIISFANELAEHLKSLEKLQLNFSRRLNKLTKRGCMVKFERFHEGGKLITDVSLKAIGEALTKCGQRLQYLELHFDGCDEVTDEGLGYLAEAIEKGKGNLKKVRLSFEWCESDLLRGEYVEEIRKRFSKEKCGFGFQLDWINQQKYFDDNPDIFD